MAIKDKKHIVGILKSTLRSYYDNFPEEDMPMWFLDKEDDRYSVHEEFGIFLKRMAENLADEIFTTKEERQEFVQGILEGYR
jgi:hypothetical protein